MVESAGDLGDFVVQEVGDELRGFLAREGRFSGRRGRRGRGEAAAIAAIPEAKAAVVSAPEGEQPPVVRHDGRVRDAG